MVRLLSPESYCCICGGVASVSLVRKVQLDVEIGYFGLRTNVAGEAKQSRRRSGKSLAGAHGLDLYWLIPQWFSQMSLSTCFIYFAEPSGRTPTESWCQSYYINLVLSLCNMCINCDTVALVVNFKVPDPSEASSPLVTLTECPIDRFGKDLERFLGPGMVEDISQKSNRSLPVIQATLQYHPRQHMDRFSRIAWEEKFQNLLLEEASEPIEFLPITFVP